MRFLAWQQVVYGEKHLPTWLRDSLVNTLNLIAEDAYWIPELTEAHLKGWETDRKLGRLYCETVALKHYLK